MRTTNDKTSQTELNAIYYVPQKQRMLDDRGQRRSSLCWDCERAYAMPDPEGCAFHRREHDAVYDTAETDVTAAGDLLVRVLTCSGYRRTSPTKYEPAPKQGVRPTANTAERREQAMTRRRQGATFQQIASELGIAVSTAKQYCWCGKATLPTLYSKHKEQVLSMLQDGMSYTAIGKVVGVSRRTISGWHSTLEAERRGQTRRRV